MLRIGDTVKVVSSTFEPNYDTIQKIGQVGKVCYIGHGTLFIEFSDDTRSCFYHHDLQLINEDAPNNDIVKAKIRPSKKIDKYIANIKKANFDFIKIELEARLNRFYNGDYGDYGDANCEDIIMQNLSREARKAIVYSEFYNDHSVDSEFTFTMAIMDLPYCLEVIKAFKKLSEVIGNGLDANGAGMHITLMETSDYGDLSQLPNRNLSNFSKEVTKLLPALFIAACSSNQTRELHFREPRISDDIKYSAIYTHNRTCLEYRIFETCYDRPESLYDFVGTISKTLDYYIFSQHKVEAQQQTYTFIDQKGVDGFLATPEQVKVIQKTFKFVKPDGVSKKSFLHTRGIKISLRQANANKKSQIKKLQLAFKERCKTFDTTYDKYEEERFINHNLGPITSRSLEV
jgi:hypothetical protein